MEDQRNWTDASFKTYSTPLRLPYPAPVAAGTVIEQTVRLNLSATSKKIARVPSPEAVQLSLEPEREPGRLPRSVDVRQMSLFGAGWTIGSLRRLSEGGATGITYYETCGWRGVMDAASGSPLPTRFRSLPGSVFPLFHVFADVAEFKGGEVLRSETSVPLSLDDLVLRRDDRLRILVANMSGQHQTVSVAIGTGVTYAQARMLDKRNVQRAMKDPASFRLEAPETVRNGGLL